MVVSWICLMILEEKAPLRRGAFIIIQEILEVIAVPAK